MLSEEPLRAVERLLAETHGRDVRLRWTEEFRDGRVGRCADGDDTTVVVKLPEADGAGHPDPRTMHGELAALQLLGEVRPSMAPQLLAVDGAQGILVLEDLGDGPSLATALLADDPDAACAAAVLTATALGAMHAATAGHGDRFYELLGQFGEADRVGDRFRFRGMDIRQRVASLDDLLARHDLPTLSGAARDDLDAVLAELDEPGSFLALSNGDPCPDNGRVLGDEVRFFDFEAALFRHALADAAHYRVPFPNCWCWRRLPDEVEAAMENAYRAELVAGCPKAADDHRYNTALAHMMAAWLVWTLHRRLRGGADDAEMRIRTVTTLDKFLSAADRAEAVAGLARWAEAARTELRRRWPDTIEAAPTYPAFGGPPFV